MNSISAWLRRANDIIFAKKSLNTEYLEVTQLSRVLNLIDLSFLGVSCTLGSGIYVLAGFLFY